MTTLAIEINDAAIAVAHGGKIVATESGCAASNNGASSLEKKRSV